MKTALVLEDTPEGLTVKVAYQSSGISDDLSDSLSMNVTGNLLQFITSLQDLGAIRLVRSAEG